MSPTRWPSARAALRDTFAMVILLAAITVADMVVATEDRTAKAEPGAQNRTAKAEPAPTGGGGNPLGQLSLDSSKEPIHVKSDELEFDYETNRVVYRGTVNVVQGDIAIDCRELVINLTRAGEKDDLQLHEVVAIGDVVITQGQRKATGGRAVFDQVKRQVTLLENPMLRDGPNEVAGERIVVYLDENRSVVESSPKKRVSAILYPGRDGEKADQDGQPQAPGAKP